LQVGTAFAVAALDFLRLCGPRWLTPRRARHLRPVTARKKKPATRTKATKKAPKPEPEPAPDRVTTVELAAHLGVTRQAIEAAAKAGRIKRGPDKRFDLEVSAEAWERTRSHPAGPGRGHVGETAKPVRVPRSPDAEDHCPVCGEVRDLMHWKTLATREDYRAKRIARRELEGALVRRDKAEAELAELAATTRGLLEKVGAAVRDDLAAETDPRRCGDIVDKEIRLVLQQAAESYAESAGMELADPDDMGTHVDEDEEPEDDA